jgi:hypothetical protein
MMKQPAENTNATADEIKKAEERRRPPTQNAPEDRERADKLARKLAGDQSDPDPSVKARAQEVLRNQKNAEAKP